MPRPWPDLATWVTLSPTNTKCSQWHYHPVWPPPALPPSGTIHMALLSNSTTPSGTTRVTLPPTNTKCSQWHYHPVWPPPALPPSGTIHMALLSSSTTPSGTAHGTLPSSDTTPSVTPKWCCHSASPSEWHHRTLVYPSDTNTICIALPCIAPAQTYPGTIKTNLWTSCIDLPMREQMATISWFTVWLSSTCRVFTEPSSIRTLKILSFVL